MGVVRPPGLLTCPVPLVTAIVNCTSVGGGRQRLAEGRGIEQFAGPVLAAVHAQDAGGGQAHAVQGYDGVLGHDQAKGGDGEKGGGSAEAVFVDVDEVAEGGFREVGDLVVIEDFKGRETFPAALVAVEGPAVFEPLAP